MSLAPTRGSADDAKCGTVVPQQAKSLLSDGRCADTPTWVARVTERDPGCDSGSAFWGITFLQGLSGSLATEWVTPPFLCDHKLPCCFKTRVVIRDGTVSYYAAVPKTLLLLTFCPP